MTKEDYEMKMFNLNQEFEQKEKEIMIEYARDQIKFKKGDIISHPYRGILLIEVIATYEGLNPFPEPVYKGHLLTKELIQRKDKTIGSIFGSDENITLLKSIDNKMIRTKHKPKTE